VNRQGVEVVREEWRVLDRWWTEELVARYFEVVLEGGQNVAVFRDEGRGGWFPREAPRCFDRKRSISGGASWLREVDAPAERPYKAAQPVRERPRRARSCSRTREIFRSSI
jgi:hypothetical protein